jgi:6-pyruvoyltetrahydropterin 2'-reductase
MSKIRLAQKPFLSVQGEGPRTGKLIIFVRFAACNLKCKGFFQKDPTNPDTYVEALKTEPKLFKTLDEFPVVEYGCDTLYAIDPRFKHLWLDYDSVEELLDEIESLLPKHPKFDNIPSWIHPDTGNRYDLCFTGGEPLLHQAVITEILNALSHRPRRYHTMPDTIQFETNGTQELSNKLLNALPGNVLFNISPKLFNVTGEKAWYPEYINALARYKVDVALKFVVNDTKAAFDELDEKVKDITADFPIYVMPVGSSMAQQSDYSVINRIALMAVDRGYHISGRAHVIYFGNDTDR